MICMQNWLSFIRIQLNVIFFIVVLFVISLAVLPKLLVADTLSDQLQDFVDKYVQKAPEQQQKDFDDSIQDIQNSGVLETAVQVGDLAPDFTLPNSQGTSVALSDLLNKGPVVLVWYRGGWCPYCNIQLGYLQQRLHDIQSAGGQLVAISPELPDKILTTKEKHQLKFEVLSDIGNLVAARYGIVYTVPEKVRPYLDKSLDLSEYNGDDSYTLPLAVTYVIDRGGKIVYAFLDADYRHRAEPDDIISVLHKLNKE